MKRFWAFVRGDMVGAEDLAGYPPSSTPPVVVRARTDRELAAYLIEIASKARDRTDAVLSGIQSKASTFLTLVIGLVPLALAAVALAVPPDGAQLVRWISFLLLIGTVLALVAAATAAALASGMGLTASLNLGFLEKEGAPKTVEQLMADEADTWNYAAILNMETSRRRAMDLFRARRMTVLALLLALVGLTALIGSVGGRPAALLGGAAASQTAAPLSGNREHGVQTPIEHGSSTREQERRRAVGRDACTFR